MAYIPKFRVWDKLNKEWDKDFTLSQDGELLSYGGIVFNKDNLEISFSSGKEDKNDKEIFNGDLVLIFNSKSPCNVEFQEGCFMLSDDHNWQPLSSFYSHSLEVVDNIYENNKIFYPGNPMTEFLHELKGR